MHYSVATLSLVALAGASPVARSLSTSKAYQLQVSLLDPSKDLNPSINNLFLSTYHTGAGISAAVIGPNKNLNDAPFYSNGTVTAGYTDVLNDLGTDFSSGINIQGKDATDPAFPGEHAITVNTGGGSNGLGIAATDTTAQLNNAETGDFAVCPRELDTPGAGTLNVVRFVYEGETIPQGCVGVQFVPVCAQLNTLPDGAQATHDFAQEVPCVSA